MPSSADRLIQTHLFRTGHFWNARKQDLLNVDHKSVRKLDRSHSLFKLAVQSAQEADMNYEILYRAWMAKKEKLETASIAVPPFDGEIDPPTRALFKLRRCPVPDHLPPDDITFDDPVMRDVVRSMQDWKGTGSGSWPVGCDSLHPNYHSIIVRIDPARMPATIKAYHVQALAEVTKAYAEIGLHVRYVLDSSSKCHIAKQFQNLAGSVIGWNQFPSGGTCNQTIDGRLDTGYAPSNWLLWANLECHETGHGVGLQHTRGSIMNPSILLVNPLTWIGTPSFAALKRYFGGESIFPDIPMPTWVDFYVGF